jgi:hypothetical protein
VGGVCQRKALTSPPSSYLPRGRAPRTHGAVVALRFAVTVQPSASRSRSNPPRGGHGPTSASRSRSARRSRSNPPLRGHGPNLRFAVTVQTSASRSRSKPPLRGHGPTLRAAVTVQPRLRGHGQTLRAAVTVKPSASPGGHGPTSRLPLLWLFGSGIHP